MEQHARTPADLDAMLIGQKSVPKGCRVLNVSPQGMMLQCEPDGRLLTFRDADLVEVHLTVQHDGGRKKFAIPSIVNRVDLKSIDVVFQHPNTELLKLIEAYRISDAHMMEASIALSPQETIEKVSELPNTTVNAATVETEDASSKREGRGILYPVLATLILTVCIAAGAYLYTSGIDRRLGVLETITINQTNELAEIRSRIFSSSLQEGRYASLNARLQALTDAFGTLEGKLDTVISSKPLPTGSVAGKAAAGTIATGGSETPISITPITPEKPASTGITATATLLPQVTETSAGPNISTDKSQSAPVPAVIATSEEQSPETLASNSKAALMGTSERTATQQSIKTEQPGAAMLSSTSKTEQPGPAMLSSTSKTEQPGPAKLSSTSKTEQPGPAKLGSTSKIEQPGPAKLGSTSGDVESEVVKESGKAAVAAPTGSGPWIINLLSSRKKLDTDRLAKIAATHGIPVVQNRAIVKGKEYWRLQVTGFGNATEAKNYAIPIKKKLGIKDVWIFQQKG